MKNILFSLKSISRVLFAVVLLLLVGHTIQAGNIITGGTTLRVMAGTTLVSSEALVIKSGATVSNAGTLVLKKELTNENASANSLGTGTVQFSGTAAQTITGTNTITNMTVNNTAGVNNSGETKVTGALTLTSGKIILGTNNLSLGTGATISGSFSASNMIVATGSGQLRKEFLPGYTGTFTYPVGDATSTAEYSPVTVVILSGTFAGGNYIGVALVNAKYPDPSVSGNYLKRYWTLSQSGVTNLNCNATFQYVAADVTGTENKISCTKVNPAPWITYALTNAATHLLSATGITSFSTFTGVKTDLPPAEQELANITIPAGISNCYDATSHLTVAGDGATFVVDNTGSVTLIAGEVISMMPGVIVNPGGYLHAYISTTYCGASSFNPLVANLDNETKALLEVPEVTPAFFKVYPNPTSDIVILELTQENPGTVLVTLYNMNGKQVIRQTLNGEQKHQFSLAAQPVGLYIIQVKTDDQVDIAKIVRK